MSQAKSTMRKEDDDGSSFLHVHVVLVILQYMYSLGSLTISQSVNQLQYCTIGWSDLPWCPCQWLYYSYWVASLFWVMPLLVPWRFVLHQLPHQHPHQHHRPPHHKALLLFVGCIQIKTFFIKQQLQQLLQLLQQKLQKVVEWVYPRNQPPSYGAVRAT